MRTRFPLLVLALFGLVAGSCNRHSWDDTKELYKEHGDHGGGEKPAADKEQKAGEHP